MDKEEKKFVAEGSIKALVSFIPGIGGAIGSILSDALADRKEQRIKEFLQQLRDEIESNKAYVNTNFLKEDDFLDVFEATAKKIANERDSKIREAYINIVLHGILSPNYDYDTVEYQMKILEQLNKEHIKLLALFYKPDTFNIPDMSNIIGGSLLQLFREVYPEWEKNYLFDLLSDLQNNRLIENITGNLQTMMSSVSAENLKNKLTPKGTTFVSFILR